MSPARQLALLGAVAAASALAGFAADVDASPAPGIHTIKHVDRDHAGEPLVRLLLRHLPRRRRHPDEGRRAHRLRARSRPGTRASGPIHDSTNRNAGGPHDHRDAMADINGGKMDGFIIRRGAAAHLACVANVDTPACSLAPRSAGRDGLPRRARDPELLVLGAELRPPGPHVRAGHLVEPARAPLHGLRLVGEVREARRPDELQACGAGARARRPGSRRTRPTAIPDYAWTDLTYLLHRDARQLALLRLPRRRSPTATTATMYCKPVPQNAKTPGIWNPAAVVRHGPAGPPARRHRAVLALLRRGAARGRSRRSPGSRRRRR